MDTDRSRSPYLRSCLLLAALLASASAVAAQGPAFSSPGTPTLSTSGQTTRFSTEFNPAIGLVLDLYGDAVDDDFEDGFDAELRLLELNLSAYVDPEAWAYVVLTSEGGESPEVEEAAVEYLGLPGNQTLRAGRFFVDFGKQMQHHLEELRTLERPLPLREYLGEELSGVGVQYDNWLAAGDATPVRLSLGVFASLLGEGHGHGEEVEGEEPEGAVPGRKDLDELSLTARVTGMTDVGATGLLQLGASARVVPEFAFEGEGLEAGGLSNTVLGLDATFARTDDTGLKTLLLGGEVLHFTGDLAAAFDDPDAPGAIQVVDDDATGFFVFGDWGWSREDSAGVQLALADLAEDPGEDARELDLYYTRHLTEFRRLRLGVTLGEEADEEFTRVYLQFTSFFGNHSHGLNW